MVISGVDQERCIGCGNCLLECPANLFSGEKGCGFSYADPNKWCTGCGHCVAVCPKNAIRYEAVKKVQPLPAAIPDGNVTMHLLQSKRSIRNYTPEKVPKSEVEKVIEAMVCAPTGHNSQNVDFTIITGATQKAALRQTTIDAFKTFRKVMRFHRILKPFLPETMYELMSDRSVMLGIDDMVARYNSGEDPIFFNAPVVVVGHNPDMGEESFIDSTIAFTYGMLAAHAIGLGSCWMGFTIMAVKKNKKIHKLLNIRKGRKITAVMTLGYTSVKYMNIPVRKDRTVTWFE